MAIDPREQRPVSRQVFGRSQEQKAPGAEREVKQRHELRLQIDPQVDEDVSTRDEVERGKRWVLDQAVLRERARVPEFLDDPERPVLPDEEPRQALRRDVLEDVVGVAAVPRRRHELAVDVRGEDLDRARELAGAQVLENEHRDRVGLLAGGATRHPDAHRRARVAAVEYRRQAESGEGLEGLRIAKEMRHPNREIPDERLRLSGVPLELLDVVGGRTDVPDPDASRDPTNQRARLVAAEVVPGAPQEDLANRLAGARRRRRRHGRTRAAERARAGAGRPRAARASPRRARRRRRVPPRSRSPACLRTWRSQAPGRASGQRVP